MFFYGAISTRFMLFYQAMYLLWDCRSKVAIVPECLQNPRNVDFWINHFCHTRFCCCHRFSIVILVLFICHPRACPEDLPCSIGILGSALRLSESLPSCLTRGMTCIEGVLKFAHIEYCISY